VHEWTAMSSRISLGRWARKGISRGHRQRPGDIGRRFHLRAEIEVGAFPRSGRAHLTKADILCSRDDWHRLIVGIGKTHGFHERFHWNNRRVHPAFETRIVKPLL